jgi:hypothetical protein
MAAHCSGRDVSFGVNDDRLQILRGGDDTGGNHTTFD